MVTCARSWEFPGSEAVATSASVPFSKQRCFTAQELQIPDANALVFGFYLEERLARVLSVLSPAHVGDTRGGLVASEVRKVETGPIGFPGPHVCVSLAFSCVGIKSSQV